MRLVTVKALGALGRIVIPSELRESWGLRPGTPLSIYVDDEGERIILQPVRGRCTFCGGAPVSDHRGRFVCRDCIREIAALGEDRV